MKKLILILALAVLPFLASAQTGSAKTQTREEYCLLTASKKLLSKKVGVGLTFKQQAAEADKLLAAEAHKITFATVVDALNYMADHGWQLVTAYADTTDPTTNYYIMRRPVPPAGS
jgi:hypothetical protein